MPWTRSDYPNAMKNLSEKVRHKAIDIGNALLDERNDMDEGIVIATAISRAKDWAANRGFKTESTSEKSKTTDVKEHGKDRYVIPYGKKEWAVKEEGVEKVEKVFRTKSEAVKLATAEAREANAAVTIQKRTGQVQKRTSYNPNRKG